MFLPSKVEGFEEKLVVLIKLMEAETQNKKRNSKMQNNTDGAVKIRTIDFGRIKF